MNKIVGALCALALATSLTACSDSDSPPAETAPTVTVTAEPTPDAATTDEAFLSVVRDEYPELNLLPDEQLVELANVSCDAFDRGATADDVFDNILASSNDPETQESMAYVIGAGVGVYCPEHLGLFESGLAS